MDEYRLPDGNVQRAGGATPYSMMGQQQTTTVVMVGGRSGTNQLLRSLHAARRIKFEDAENSRVLEKRLSQKENSHTKALGASATLQHK